MSHEHKPWDGVERRQCAQLPEKTDEALWALLHEIRDSLLVHLEQEKLMKPKLDELVAILERSKGIVTFFKVLIYIGAPLTAFIAWSRDHIKW